MSFERRVAVIAGALGAVFFSLNAALGAGNPAVQFTLAFLGGLSVTLSFGFLLKSKRRQSEGK